MIWTRSWCYFHCATTHPPPTTQQTFLEEVKPQNQYRLTSSHDIMIMLWRQVSWTSQLLSGWPPVLQDSSPDFVDRSHLDRENDILGRQVLNKSWSCCEDRCTDHPSSCQDDPLSSQILFNKSDNTKQTNNKTVLLIPLKSLTFKWRRTCFECILGKIQLWKVLL